MHDGLVLFGVGSPLIVDVEETLHRLGVRLAAAVRNVPGEVYLIDQRTLVSADELTPGTLALPFLVPLFTPANRRHAAGDARSRGFTRAATVIDPTSVLPRSIEYGEGLYVNAGCTVGAASQFGAFVLVNRGASLGHHARLGSFVSIGPGVVLAGQVEVGSGSLVGAGAVVLPRVRIGDNAVVGAGSVVTRDVPDGCLVLGNPARVVRADVLGGRERPAS